MTPEDFSRMLSEIGELVDLLRSKGVRSYSTVNGGTTFEFFPIESEPPAPSDLPPVDEKEAEERRRQARERVTLGHIPKRQRY